jgi:hypothetical protein
MISLNGFSFSGLLNGILVGVVIFILTGCGTPPCHCPTTGIQTKAASNAAADVIASPPLASTVDVIPETRPQTDTAIASRQDAAPGGPLTDVGMSSKVAADTNMPNLQKESNSESNPAMFAVKGAFGIVESALATGITERIPSGISDTFTVDVDKIWAYVKVRNRGVPTRVRMVWKQSGQVRMSVNLRVGKSPGWRTWSYKRISTRDVGSWTVDVLTEEGKLLHTLAFRVLQA